MNRSSRRRFKLRPIGRCAAIVLAGFSATGLSAPASAPSSAAIVGSGVSVSLSAALGAGSGAANSIHRASGSVARSVMPLRTVLPTASVGGSIVRSVTRYFGKEGAQESAEFLARSGGKELAERVAATASREGGEEAVQRIAELAARQGPETLYALDNVADMMPVLKALDELPAGQVGSALAKLAAGSSGQQLGQATARFGAAAIRSELKHPGVGLLLVKTLGDDGVELAAKLTDGQAVAVARHADDIAKLPATQRTGIVEMIRTNTDDFTAFVGRFVENNPGKSLFTAAATTLVLAEPERILGGDEIAYDADGKPYLISRDGIAGRSIRAGGDVVAHVSNRYLQPLFYAAIAFAAVFLGGTWILRLRRRGDGGGTV